MCDLIVVTRPGYEIDSPNGIDSIDIRGMDKSRVVDLLNRETRPRMFLTDAALVDVSATKIRAAVQSGDRESLQAMVPPAVAHHIEKYGLYKTE